MKYSESLPSPRFAAVVKCYWSIESDDIAHVPQPVLPDGCTEIVFNLADRFERLHFDGGVEIQPRVLVAGQMRKGISIQPTGKVHLFGVRFLPAGAFGFLGSPMSELTDRIENATNIFGRSIDSMLDRLAEATSFNFKISVFEDLLDGYGDRVISRSPELGYALDVISEDDPPIAQVANRLGWSERRLERTFKERVGLSPKTFSRINRFQRLLRLLESDTSVDLAAAAIDCGYYDQPHMNRDFASFAHTSPKAFLDASHRISELFVVGE